MSAWPGRRWLRLFWWGTASVLLLASAHQAAGEGVAQMPPLALSVRASPDPAVAGELLTYIIALTNTGGVPLDGVVVSAETPSETLFVGVDGPVGWEMTSPGQGRAGAAAWRATRPLPAGGVVHLRFVVTLVPNAQGPIVSDKNEARAGGWAGAVTGSPVTVPVTSPTPTWTPPSGSREGEAPTVSPTPTWTPPFPTSVKEARAVTATASPGATPGQAQVEATPLPVPLASLAPPGEVAGGMRSLPALGAVLVVALCLAGAILLFRSGKGRD